MQFKKMKQVDIQPHMTVDELLSSMKEGGFTCRKVALATELLEEMIGKEIKAKVIKANYRDNIITASFPS